MKHIPIEILSTRSGDARYSFARAFCSSCGARTEVRVGGGSANYEHAAKKMRSAGWDIDISHQRVRCPSCNSPKRQKPEGGQVVTPKIPTSPTKSIASTPAPGLASEAITARTLSPDQRARIRRELDAHFDDTRGCYLDGMSDKKIGESLGIPWAFVRDLREAAYGKITSDGVLDDLKQEADKVRADLKSAFEAALTEADTKLSAIMRSIDERLGQLR